MQNSFPIRVISALIFAFCSHNSTTAQQPQEKCSQIGYSTPKAGASPYLLDRIEGQAVFAPVSEKRDIGPVSGSCVALFDERDRKHIATIMTDSKGQFEFSGIAPGRFVLVTLFDDTDDIIVPILVNGSSKNRTDQPGRLLLHLRLKEDKTKSFVTLVTNPALRKELIKMVEQDQAVRNDLIKKGSGHPDEADEARMAAIDSKNTARMKEIVRRYGWPGPALVGFDGTEAAFLIVQHADFAFQQTMLPIIKKAYRSGELSGQSYALLLDRVLVREGKPQVYGTQAKPFAQWKAGEPVFEPIEDEPNVDKRRAEVGLSSMSEYRERLKQMYFSQGKPNK